MFCLVDAHTIKPVPSGCVSVSQCHAEVKVSASEARLSGYFLCAVRPECPLFPRWNACWRTWWNRVFVTPLAHVFCNARQALSANSNAPFDLLVAQNYTLLTARDPRS